MSIDHRAIGFVQKTRKTGHPTRDIRKPCEQHEQRLGNDGSIIASSSTQPQVQHRANEIFKWTMTSDAVASCFVQDVLDMKHDPEGFYWLGRVPCRTVLVIGIVVGVHLYEKRIRYTIDDGTAVIDCLHRPVQPSRMRTKSGSYTKPVSSQLPPLLKPTVHVGYLVRIVGRVVPKFETREIIADTIERCRSFNDEPHHWKSVLELHRASYDLSEPFIIPSTLQKEALATVEAPARKVAQPVTSPAAPSTPSTTTASPPKSTISQASPQKLRHPSRLHSRDLTQNTFRIYVKHYMDNCPDNESVLLTSDWMQNGYPSTPTKSRKRSLLSMEETPHASIDPSTPLPKTPLVRAGCGAQSQSPLSQPEASMQGFTLSYLRRVPELSQLARRVVGAEAKRRMKEEREKSQKSQTKGSVSTQKTPSSRSGSNTPLEAAQDREKVRQRVKRLFMWAIRQLLQEGSIVLWDGPIRPCPTSVDSLAFQPGNASGLWISTISSANTTSSSIFSSASASDRCRVDKGDAEMLEFSDPESDEESYIPLSAPYLAVHVERIIGRLTGMVDPQAKRALLVTSAGTYKKRPEAPTKEVILASLRRDERWRYVGEWNVDEALQHLKEGCRAWCIGHGKWELTV